MYMVFIYYFVLVESISLRNVSVPRYGVRDGVANLGCFFDLEPSEKLLFLKWYKDEAEFYRFTPSQNSLSILTFPLSGVVVNVSKSNLAQVSLMNLSLNSSGTYKCEVMAEGTFQTPSAQSHLLVIAPPELSPVISGFHPFINLNERIKGNCTSYKSNPRADLTIYVNNIPLAQPDVSELKAIEEGDGLLTSILSFDFTVESSNVNTKNFIELKCTATIHNLYWVHSVNLSQVSINAQPSYINHNRLSSGAGSGNTKLRSRVFLFSFGALFSVILILNTFSTLF